MRNTVGRLRVSVDGLVMIVRSGENGSTIGLFLRSSSVMTSPPSLIASGP